MATNIINKEISVTSYFFGSNATAYPRRIECDGMTYTFKQGRQYVIRTAQTAVRLYEMIDETARYRIVNDEKQHSWLLLAITAGSDTNCSQNEQQLI